MKRLWNSALAALAALAMLCGLSIAQDTRAAKPLKPQQATTLERIVDQLGSERSFALIVGISEFDRLPHLRGTQPEAKLIAEALAEHGFSIERAGESGRLTKDQLKATVAAFLERHGKKAENRLIIYFATHGYAAADAKEYGFLAASDTQRPGLEGFEASAYSVRELSTALAGLSAQHIFLFFNSCFSGAMLPELRGEEDRTMTKPASLQGLAPEVAEWTLSLLSHNARLALTAGNDSQTVPDRNNPYSRGVIDGLAGAADADGDGLILGSELAQFVRGRVARETRKKGKGNDAVFAILTKKAPPAEPRPDAPQGVIDYGLQGDFIFLAKDGPRDIAAEGRDELAEIVASRAKRLPQGQFVDCADCPVMVEMPGARTALGRTEVTFAEWDACYRESGCRRYLPDGGLGRGDRPASGMTWQDAYEFRTWLQTKNKDRCEKYRLPTKDEWLTAAGFTGDSVASVAADGRSACSGCGPGRDEGHALPVASLPANPLGFHDMEGNVWEWVVEKASGTTKAEDKEDCPPSEFSNNGSCEVEGTVMGGSFATAAASLTLGLEGRMPRTSNENPWSWPTVGLRIACDME